MLKGGYKIIDFKDNNLTTETPVVITGIYNDIENNYRKPLLISGITIDGVEKPDCFIACTHAENSYSFTLYGRTVTVSNADSVSIAAA